MNRHARTDSAPYQEVHHSSYRVMFLGSISPGLHLCSCSQGAFIWLQVAVNLKDRFLKNFNDEDDIAQMELPQL